MSLSSRLELAITELRMQMLSTEVLFGFQLQSVFREGFAHLSQVARTLDVVALTSLVATLCALIAAPAQHRIVERGPRSRHCRRSWTALLRARRGSVAMVANGIQGSAR